ncbi:hypothetical protein [Alteromonas gracilis]|uniref:hypothetical protein n=1 Tax=Alteromonas gracilis TaxID=1479524 RepID=UPI0030CB98BA
MRLQPSKERYQIGVMFTFSATSNQLRRLIESLDVFEQVDCLAVVSEQDLTNHRSWFDTNCNAVNFFVFTDETHDELAQFDALILPESNVSIYHYIPPNVIRIGLPHGTDVAIYSTLFTYGGGFCFDYILSATEQPTLHENVYRNTFPKLLRTQQSSSVAVVPFGSPKLDEFINEVFSIDDSKKTAIIYHLSLLSIEEHWVESQMLHVLKRLLEAFPFRLIVYRVHHLDRKNPAVQHCINMGRRYKNFHFSIDDSYVKDYAKGALMLLHREYESHLFDLATASPTLLLTKERKYKLKFEHDERYFLSTIENTIDVVSRLLSKPFDKSRAYVENRCREHGIYNPGKSISSLVDNLPLLIKRQRKTSWTQYDFDDGCNADIDSKITQLVLSKRTFGHYAFAYAKYTKNTPISLLLLAEHFVRHQSMKDYFYPHALQYFYRLLQHNGYSSVSKLAELWWVCKGNTAYKYCLSLVESGHIPMSAEIKWLNKHFKLNTKAELKSKIGKYHYNIINLRTRESLPTGEFVVVGISEATDKIVDQFGEAIVAIFHDHFIDENSNKCSRERVEYRGIPLFPFLELTKFDHNIVVASHNSLVTIVNKLTLTLGITNDMYAVVDDALLDEMVRAIPMFSDCNKSIIQKPN